MRVAALQYNPAYLDVAGNLDTVERMIGEVVVDLLVLPELFATGYFFESREHVLRVAEQVPDGPTTHRLVDWARRIDATIVAGLPELDGDQIYNSAVVVDADGLVGTYRKVHLYFEEKLHFEAGNVGMPVFTRTARNGSSYVLGVMICFDWYYPEAARSLALAGADIIAHPSNLVRPDCPRAMPIRALENHLFTVTANRVGAEERGDQTLTFIGQSLICSPDGIVLGQLDREEESLAYANIEPSQASDRQITPFNDLLADRRPSAYRLS